MLKKTTLTSQLAIGSIFYTVGYLIIGALPGYIFFIAAFVILTTGENFVSPPGMSIAANLAPEGKMGRYMGVYGFVRAAGWSLGPLFGGLFLDWVKPNFIIMWVIVALLTIAAGLGFRKMANYLPAELNVYRK